jgi:hypothetical protein
VRALEAGSSAEVTAVRDDVLGKDNPAALLADSADPWAAILAGLLKIRFPEIVHPIDSAWADELVRRAGWAFDAHVIRASRLFAATSNTDHEAQDQAVADAVAVLAKAQVAGSPYYRYTNQLFGEMAGGIAEYLKVNEPRVIHAAAREFDRLYTRWQREVPLQRGAGSTFTWLARDQAALKESNVLVPYRHPSGKLRPRDTLVIFQGQVSAGHIEIIAGARNSSQPVSSDVAAFRSTAAQSDGKQEHSLSRMPSLARPPGPADDPNKGRFGGEESRGGFRLMASFEPTASRDRAIVVLNVEAESSAKVGLGDFAWFVLHPTFSPPVLKVAFRGNRARLRIWAWGGFTVGVWVPKADVELECDLSRLEGAPKIIRAR